MLLSQPYLDYKACEEFFVRNWGNITMGEGLSGYSVEGLAVGRVVHYVKDDGLCYAALVIRVNSTMHPGDVDLRVFSPEVGDETLRNVIGDQESKSSGSWHWPERD